MYNEKTNINIQCFYIQKNTIKSCLWPRLYRMSIWLVQDQGTGASKRPVAGGRCVLVVEGSSRKRSDDGRAGWVATRDEKWSDRANIYVFFDRIDVMNYTQSSGGSWFISTAKWPHFPFSAISHQPPMDRLGPTVWGDGAFPGCLRNGNSSCSLGPGPLDGQIFAEGLDKTRIQRFICKAFLALSSILVASWKDLDFGTTIQRMQGINYICPRWLKHVIFLSSCGSSAGLNEMHLRIVHSGTWRDSTCPNIAIIYTTSWRNEMNDTSYVLIDLHYAGLYFHFDHWKV